MGPVPDSILTHESHAASVATHWSRPMHDYQLVRIIHNDRMAQFEREADAARLASEARRGRQRRPTTQRPSALGIFKALARIATRRARVPNVDITLRAE